MRGRPHYLPPVQLKSGNGLVWWHIPIEIKRSIFGCGKIKNCQPRLIRQWERLGDPPPGDGTHMVWFTGDEYKDSLTLETGYVYYLPIAQRTEGDTEHDAIITNSSFVRRDGNEYKWERDQNSEFELQFRTKYRRIKGPKYFLYVPDRGESNGMFRLEMYRPDLLSG